jgi:tRNA (guanine-N7-)-methyltransferase
MAWNSSTGPADLPVRLEFPHGTRTPGQGLNDRPRHRAVSGTTGNDESQTATDPVATSTDQTSSPASGHRAIRSFVRREGRITDAQRRALNDLWPRFGLDLDGTTLDLCRVFGRDAPRCLEIGFGNGDAVAAMAREHPDSDFLAADVYRPGIGSLLLKLEKSGLENVRVFRDDAVTVFRQRIPDGSLSAVMLFFPDPWPKKRHHKRRILQPDFTELVRRKLTPGGIFHMATDWQNYAEQMLDVMEQQTGFANAAGPGQFSEDRGWRPPTRFEQRGLALGH